MPIKTVGYIVVSGTGIPLKWDKQSQRLYAFGGTATVYGRDDYEKARKHMSLTYRDVMVEYDKQVRYKDRPSFAAMWFKLRIVPLRRAE